MQKILLSTFQKGAHSPDSEVSLIGVVSGGFVCPPGPKTLRMREEHISVDSLIFNLFITV